MTGLTAIWAGVHLQLARITDCPELAMGEPESRQFLLAWQNYLRHYSITATQKTVDLMTAVGVTAFIYVPRTFALAARRQAATRGGQRQGPAQVFQFSPRAPGGPANGSGEVPAEPVSILADGPPDLGAAS